jgi:NADP-dependent 3-hydroxy acid dehydrogenase YdfG
MPISATIALAYCADDQIYAERIERALGPVANFRHFVGGTDNNGQSLSEQLSDFSGPRLLLVSDNFLKNPNCMHHATRLLSSRGNGAPETQVVLLDVERYDQELEETVQVRASVKRQADIMNYINHWQERYLDLRRQKTALSEEIGADFDQYLGRIREISGQINDFLHYLKDSMPLRLAEFSADRYRQFFIFMEAQNQWENFTLAETSSPREESPESPAIEAEVPATLDSQISPPPPEEEEEEEEEASTESTEDESERVSGLIQRAWAMADAGEWRTSLDLLRSGKAAYPEHPELIYHEALLLATEADDEHEARNLLDELLSERPDYADALFLSGELYLADADYNQAKEQWEQLADISPDYPDLNQELGLLLATQYPEESVAAAGYLGEAVKADSEDSEVYFHYGRILGGEMQQSQKAIRYLKKAKDLDPENAAAFYELARQQHASGEYKLALANYHHACALAPAFQTEENERAFAPPAKQKPRLMTEQESGALSALKDNIAQLESLLQERELAAEAAAAEAAQAEREARVGHGKTVLISGATSGIGLATAKRLAADGYRLILTGRREDRLNSLSEELTKNEQVAVLTLSFDVRDAEKTRQTIDALAEEWSNIDILINNAGKAKGFDPIHEGDLKHWDEMIDVNLKGLLYLTRAVSPGMVSRKKGFILNICSTAGKEVYPKGNVYCATKHAVDALTKAMRIDLVEHGVRVGQVCPAHVEETEFAEVRFDGDKQRAAKVYEDFRPLTATDVAETVAFMLSRPEHVNIMDVTLQGRQQASSTMIDRSGR